MAGLGAEGGAATGPGWGWGKGKGKGREVGPIVILGQLPHLPLLSSSLMTPHQQTMDLVPAGPEVPAQVPRGLSLSDPPWF